MKAKIFQFLYLISISLNLTISGMEKRDEQIQWDKLPVELKSYILSLIPEGKKMRDILKSLKNSTQVSKEFRGLVKDLVYGPEVVGNLAKIYIEKYPDQAHREFFMASLNSIYNGNKDVVRALIKGGIDVNTKNAKGQTALMYAAESPNSNKAMVKILIDLGADVNLKDNDGNTALILAARSNDIEKVKLLIENGAEIDVKLKDGATALMESAARGYKEMVQLLLSLGANINATSANGWSPIMWANRYGNLEVARMLRKALTQ